MSRMSHPSERREPRAPPTPHVSTSCQYITPGTSPTALIASSVAHPVTWLLQHRRCVSAAVNLATRVNSTQNWNSGLLLQAYTGPLHMRIPVIARFKAKLGCVGGCIAACRRTAQMRRHDHRVLRRVIFNVDHSCMMARLSEPIGLELPSCITSIKSHSVQVCQGTLVLVRLHEAHIRFPIVAHSRVLAPVTTLCFARKRCKRLRQRETHHLP